MEKPHVKHTAKDSFFSSLALANDNLKKIYLSLHPEDTLVKDSDLVIKRIENVIFTGIYNDLSFTVRGKAIVFLEVQSTWSNNILLRFLRYYAELLPSLIDRYLRLQYKSKSMEDLVVPEFYLLYTGKDKRKEKELELSKVFFSEVDNINLKVKVLTKDNADGILKEYTEFCIIFDECKKRCETAEEAIAKTIEIAKDRGLLREFIRDREIEVMRMMSDDILWELEIKHYMENQRREGIDEGIILGEEEGFKKGIECGRQNGLEEGLELGKKSGLEKGLKLGEKNGELKTLISLYKEGLLTLDKAVEKSGLAEEEFKKKLDTI